ncbi:MAG TPA: NUDIX domain-containing protein [Thioalkalivibrio sp.]|nr:NUDIX domain-containing protein [Thioalkalivibrio sp.]
MKWEILNRQRLYKGFFEFLRYELRHTRFDGTMSAPLTREMLVQRQSVAVLPYDAARDRVVLIEQFRIGALEAATGPWLTEIVAGIVEPGEQPEEVARREAMEEAGCVLGAFARTHHYLPSPSSSDEQISLFVAQVDSAGLGGLHGVAEEGEDICVRVVDTQEAFDLLDCGIINSAIPIIALQWLRLNRETLRVRWG